MKIKIINPSPVKSSVQKVKHKLKSKNNRRIQMARKVSSKTRRRKTNPSPVFLNKGRARARRRYSNPSRIGAFSVEGVTDTLMQGLVAGAGAVGVKFVTDKFFNFENPWVKYLAMAGLGLGAGYIAGTFNRNLGKQISIGAIALVAVQILNEQLLNQGSRTSVMLKGEDYDEDVALGNLTLGEIASLNEARSSGFLGAAAASQSGGADRYSMQHQNAFTEDLDPTTMNPYVSLP